MEQCNHNETEIMHGIHYFCKSCYLKNGKIFSIDSCKECMRIFTKIRPKILACKNNCKAAEKFFYLCGDHPFCKCSVVNNKINTDCTSCITVMKNRLYCHYRNRFENENEVIANPCCKKYYHTYCRSAFNINKNELQKIICDDCKIFYSDRTQAKNSCIICLSKNHLKNTCNRHKVCKQCEKLINSNTFEIFCSNIKCEGCEEWMRGLLSQSLATSSDINITGLETYHQSSKTFNVRMAQRKPKYQFLEYDRNLTENKQGLITQTRLCRICHGKGLTMECQHTYCRSCFQNSFKSIFENFLSNLQFKHYDALICENFQIKCLQPDCFNVYCVPFKEFIDEASKNLNEYQEYYNPQFFDYYSLFFEGISMIFVSCPRCDRTVGYIENFKCFYCDTNLVSRTISARNYK